MFSLSIKLDDVEEEGVGLVAETSMAFSSLSSSSNVFLSLSLSNTFLNKKIMFIFLGVCLRKNRDWRSSGVQ